VAEKGCKFSAANKKSDDEQFSVPRCKIKFRLISVELIIYSVEVYSRPTL
jgi:hypothetical protein